MRNLRAYKDELGSFKALAEETGKEPNQITQLIGKNPTRGIGDNLAKQFERSLGLRKGSLDVNRFENQPIPEYLDISTANLELVRKFSRLPREIREPLRKHIEALHGAIVQKKKSARKQEVKQST